MTSTTIRPGKHLGRSVKQRAEQAALEPWVEPLVRLGFVARGLVYLIIGALALQLALGQGGATLDPAQAIAVLGRLPFGTLLLWVVAIGLIGYALWGLIRAIFDPLHYGHKAGGLVTRGGYIVSAISYSVLAVPVVLSLLGHGSGTTAGSSGANMLPNLWVKPYGVWIVSGVGVFWLISGIGQLAIAYEGKFTQELKTETMSPGEVSFARWVGRLGYTARGAVFVIIGAVVLRAAYSADVNVSSGFYEAALRAIGQGAYGRVLLGTVAGGLVLFGLFSMIIARWHYGGRRV